MPQVRSWGLFIPGVYWLAVGIISCLCPRIILPKSMEEKFALEIDKRHYLWHPRLHYFCMGTIFVYFSFANQNQKNIFWLAFLASIGIVSFAWCKKRYVD